MADVPTDFDLDELLGPMPAGGAAAQRPEPPGQGWEELADDEKWSEAAAKEQKIRERDLTIRKQEDELAQLRDIHALRTRYVGISFFFVAVFSLAAVAIVVQSGMELLNLDSSVLIALLTTTMANVIGVLCIAFNWLFPKK